MSITAWVIVAVIIVAAFWAISSYNDLVSMRQRISQALADIGVQLKQRHDLVPNLVEIQQRAEHFGIPVQHFQRERDLDVWRG